MKMRKLKVLLGSLFLVAALAVSLAAPVMAQPPVTSPFSGTVTIDAVAAPTGTVVDVYVDGDLRATTTTTAVGWYEVVVFGTAADVGQPVTFTVDGLPAVTSPATPLFASYQPQTVSLAAVTGLTYTLSVSISPTVGGSVDVEPHPSRNSLIQEVNTPHFEADETEPEVGETVTFTNETTGGTHPYTDAWWDFGDGSDIEHLTGAEAVVMADVTHDYDTAGT